MGILMRSLEELGQASRDGAWGRGGLREGEKGTEGQ